MLQSVRRSAVMLTDPQALMRLAIEEAARARGRTGDNPWVGCVIVDDAGAVLGKGATQGPGEDHAEIAASRDALARGYDLNGATLFSTLEPCSFHGRTPACSRRIIEHGVRRVFIGMRDPHPRVDGLGIQILRDSGVEVVEGICEADVRRQLGSWVLRYHRHEPLRRASALLAQLGDAEAVSAALSETYAVDVETARTLVSEVAG